MIFTLLKFPFMILQLHVVCFGQQKRWNKEAFQRCITIFWQQLGYLYQIKPSDAQVICSANPKVSV